MTAFLAKNRRDITVWAALALVLLIGAAFRFQALNWDQGQRFHPDERAVVMSTVNIGSVALTTDVMYGPHQKVDFLPGGLSFFIPNDKVNYRPANQQETDAYNQAKSQGRSYQLPANVVAPDQPVPDGAINFWNAAYSPLNPHFFAYGDFPKYLIKIGGVIASAVTGQDWDNYDHLFMVGRFEAGLWSMGTLLLTFLLGRAAFGPSLGRNRGDAIGLLASAFMAVSVIDIQLAHFLTFDVPLAFFIILSLYMAVRLTQTGRKRTAIALGLAVGLALSCKVSAGPVVLGAILAALFCGLYGPARLSGERAGRPRMLALPGAETDKYGEDGVALGPRFLRLTILNLAIAGLVALAVWFVSMPYAFIDFTSFINRIVEEAGISRGTDSAPYTRQYVGTIPFLYQAGNLTQWGLGIPLGLLALVSILYSLWQGVRLRLKSEIILLVFFFSYSLITFSAESKFNRYMLPVVPILLIFAARMIVVEAGHRFGRSTPLDETQSILRIPAIPRLRLPSLPFKTYLVGFVALFAFAWAGIWALSFSQIYGEEHSMNQATRWMFQNIPQGATISNEYWDESLPTRITNQSVSTKSWCDPDALAQTGYCQPVMMDIYGDQPNQQKADYFVQQVKKTDYILIASNRLYATMPKLPWRYPVQIRFYELLFSGKLGYTNVATFTDYPTVPLLNWQINDDSADESFTVYDHPKVFIFKKTAPLSDEEVRGLFANAIQAPQIVKRYPGPNDLPVEQAGRACIPQNLAVPECDGALSSATAGQVKESGKTLLLDTPVDRLPVIDDVGWNQLANDNQWLAVILWFALIQLLGVVALPIAWRVCRRLPDRGYILAKPLGAVIVAILIWVMVWTRLVMNTAWTAWLAVGLVTVFSGWLWWHNRRELMGWLARHKRLILIEEALFLGVYIAWTLFRVGNPDLWHPFYGGEKPMELTHLMGILKSAYFPPYDPWFSDGYINYYYYGQYLVSTWIKLSGISPFIGFNLALPTLYAFVCTVAFSLVFNLALKYKRHRSRLDPEVDPTRVGGPVVAGLFGTLIFALVGNMDGFLQFLQRFQPMVDLTNALHLYPGNVKPLEKFDYFRSSRIIPGTINEFPSFSFTYADLHAHLIALPYTLVAMVLALNLLSTDWKDHRETKENGRSSLWQMTVGRLWQVFDKTLVTPVILMIVIGFLGATNSWDLPTYLALISASVLLALFRRYFLVANYNDLDEVTGEDEEIDPVEAEENPPYDPPVQLPRPHFTVGSVLIDVGLTAFVLVATLVGGYGLYYNFFSHFQAFFTQISLIPNLLPAASYGEDVPFISGRSEFKYFLVIFLLPLFLIASYLFWNYLNWWRVDRSLPDSGDYDEGADFEEVVEEEDAEPQGQPQAIQPTLPGFGLSLERRQTNLAFAMAGAGADGGSNFGSGPGMGSGNFFVRPGSNLFARKWVVVAGGFSLFAIVIGMVIPNNWLVFCLALSVIACCLVLIFPRAFDRKHPGQALEAQSETNIFLMLMLMAGFGVVAVTEVIFLQDDMGFSEYARMNTIFKFYYQVWALLTLAAAIAAYVVWVRWLAPGLNGVIQALPLGKAWRYAWAMIVTTIVFCAALYPVQAIPARITERSSNPIPAPTLDGRAYFKDLHVVVGMPNMPPGLVFDLGYDAQSLFEFYDNVKGTPVVLQASIWPYRGGGNWIAINTGLPALLGYDHHERQQRWPDMVDNRSQTGGQFGVIREIYTTSNIQEALDLINHYHISYIHIGTIERDSQIKDHDDPTTQLPVFLPYMSDEGYAKFEQMAKMGLLEVAYTNPGVVVYKLTPKGESGVVSGDVAAGGSISVNDPKLTKLLAAVQAGPNNAQAHYDLGQYYYTKKDYQKAAAELETVIRLTPNRVNPYHVLGDIYRDSGDVNKALAEYKAATEINAPAAERPAAFNKYGVALQAVGRYEEALQQFDAVIKLDKNFNEAFFHEAEVYEAQGKKDQAIAAYQQAIANSKTTNDFWALRANQKIRELAGK